MIRAIYRFISLFAIIIVCFTSCTAEDPLSPTYIEQTLPSQTEITVYSNPATYYNVPINSQFVSLLELELWEHTDKEFAATTINEMLYFDVSLSDDGQYSRVAIFSNGYALIQVNNNFEFGEQRWFSMHTNLDSAKSIYNDLLEYVNEHCM